jgi:hypothetical protein
MDIVSNTKELSLLELKENDFNKTHTTLIFTCLGHEHIEEETALEIGLLGNTFSNRFNLTRRECITLLYNAMLNCIDHVLQTNLIDSRQLAGALKDFIAARNAEERAFLDQCYIYSNGIMRFSPTESLGNTDSIDINLTALDKLLEK